MKLFQINKETKLPELTAEARTLEPFKTLSRRLKTCRGDADGRRKLVNEKELAYVYFASNYDSNLKYASDKEKLERLRQRLELEDSWIPDEKVLEALQVFADSQITPSTHLYESAVKAGQALQKWFDNIAKDITDHPERFKARDMKDFQDNFARLGTTMDVIRSAGEKVMAEHETRTTGKGRLMSKFETEDN